MSSQVEEGSKQLELCHLRPQVYFGGLEENQAIKVSINISY